jgi:hypothetical protein
MDDGGEGFGDCNGLVQSPDGSIELGWVGINAQGERHFGTATSRDDGVTWGVQADVGLWNFPPRSSVLPVYIVQGDTIPFPTFPSIAVSPTTGAVFDAVSTWEAPTDHWTTFLYRSVDDGATYAPVSLPPIPSEGCDGCNVTHPSLALDADGRLALEVQLVSPYGLVKETWLLVSPDDGATWLSPIQLSHTGPVQSYAQPTNLAPTDPAFWTGRAAGVLANPTDAPNDVVVDSGGRAEGGWGHVFYGGDYWSIGSSPHGFLALWEDQRSGVQSIWERIVSVS